MAEANPKKKIALIVAASVLLAALILAGGLFALKHGGDKGPTDANGDPLYPKAADVTSVEYLHRDGLDDSTGLAIEEQELTDPAAIKAFLEQLKAVELREPTEKDRAAIDYTAAVEMFTLKREKDNDVVLLVMGDSLSINNENGNYFYMTDGLDLKALTKDFEAMDLSDKVVSADTDTAISN